MHTAHQLDKQEDVFSAAIETPSASILPRLSAQYIHGFGGVDVNVWAGSNFVTAAGGVGGRLYASDYLNIDLQGAYKYYGIGNKYYSGSTDAIQPTVGISSSVTKDRMFYWGTDFQVAFPGPASQPDNDYTYAVHTLKGGIEHQINDNLSYQIELTVPTVGYLYDRKVFSYNDQTILTFIQLGFGLNIY